MADTPPRTVVVQSTRKSVGLAVVLVFLFGPLGYLYVSALGGLLLTAAYFVLSFITFGLFLPIAIVLNLVLMVVAGLQVAGSNKRDLQRIQQAVEG